jgi:hypothetical protein
MPRGQQPELTLTAVGAKREVHWKHTQTQRQQDEEAREFWADRSHRAKVTKDGKAALEENDIKVLARIEQMAKDKLSFVYCNGSSVIPGARPSSAGPRLAIKKSFATSTQDPVAAELLELTPRGSEVIKVEVFDADTLPSEGVSGVQLRVGLLIEAEPEPEAEKQKRSRRRERPKTAGDRRAPRNTSTFERSAGSTQYMTQVDLTVLQGSDEETMQLAPGLVLRSIERNRDGIPLFERKGPGQKIDPNRMTRKLYNSRTSRGLGLATTQSGDDLAGHGGEGFEGLTAASIDWTSGRDWMDDAIPVEEPVEEPEFSSSGMDLSKHIGASGAGIVKHTEFNETILNAKDWGTNPQGSRAYCPPRLPIKSPLVQLQQFDRERRAQELAARQPDLALQPRERAAPPQSIYKSPPRAREDRKATVAVQQLHKQLIKMNASSQIKMQRSRTSAAQSFGASRRPGHTNGNRAGSTDRTIWPAHVVGSSLNMSIRSQGPSRRHQTRAGAACHCCCAVVHTG